MAFNVVIESSALKELKKIKKGVPQTFSRLIRSIDSLAKDPFEGKPLQGNKKGCYSLREGDYVSSTKCIWMIRSSTSLPPEIAEKFTVSFGGGFGGEPLCQRRALVPFRLGLPVMSRRSWA